MNTYRKHLVFIIEDYRTILAHQYDAEDVPEPICVIRDGMTLLDLHHAVENWEER